MSTRAAIIVTTGEVVDGVTLRTQHSTVEDLDGVVEHLWLETSEQLLADLWRAVDALMYAGGDESYPMVVNPEECIASAARVRALLPEEAQDGE